MTWRVAALACLSAVLCHPAVAQPADMEIKAAASDERPAGVGVGKTDKGAVYVDARGLTLYGLDIRNVFGRTGMPLLYCQGSCVEQWEPLLAPRGATATVKAAQGENDEALSDAAEKSRAAEKLPSDWTIVEGAQGLQYLYKNYHLVFTRKGDAAGSTAFDGADGFIWNTLKYVPPVPKLVAPKNVSAKFVDGAYALTDDQGRLLFTGTAPADCGAGCSGWTPFPAGLASRGVGNWSVVRGGDSGQWVYKGRAVFVASPANKMDIPPQAILLRP